MKDWAHRVSGLLLALGLWNLPAQAQSDAAMRREFHDHVVRILAAVPRPALPGGDTLVTWARQGPILYHTIAVRTNEVQSSLVRNDPFVGVLVTQWKDQRPIGFKVQWYQRDSLKIDLRGRVSDGQILVTGSQVAAFPIPVSDWGIAEYGMDEHLIPALANAPLDAPPISILVLRPYSLRWDTVTVSVRASPAGRVYLWNPGKKDEVRTLTSSGGRLLYSARTDGSSERRPLELTPLEAEYQRLPKVP